LGKFSKLNTGYLLVKSTRLCVKNYLIEGSMKNWQGFSGPGCGYSHEKGITSGTFLKLFLTMPKPSASQRIPMV
jgi:hypothetical protein